VVEVFAVAVEIRNARPAAAPDVIWIKCGTAAVEISLAVQFALESVIVVAVKLPIRPVLAPVRFASIHSGSEKVEVVRVVPVPAAIVIVIPP